MAYHWFYLLVFYIRDGGNNNTEHSLIPITTEGWKTSIPKKILNPEKIKARVKIGEYHKIKTDAFRMTSGKRRIWRVALHAFVRDTRTRKKDLVDL